MNLYSHRGEKSFFSENSLFSFFLSYFLGDDGIEGDIRKTKDDVLILFHDSTIKRLSDSFGYINQITFDELSRIKFKDNYKIVKLEDLLYYLSDKQIKILLEIKEYGYEEKIIETIKKYNCKNLILISFLEKSLLRIKKIDSTIKTGLLLFDYNKYILQNIDAYDYIIFNKNFFNERIYKDLESKCNIGLWGIKNYKSLKKFLDYKFSFIICDNTYKIKKELKNNEIIR